VSEPALRPYGPETDATQVIPVITDATQVIPAIRDETHVMPVISEATQVLPTVPATRSAGGDQPPSSGRSIRSHRRGPTQVVLATMRGVGEGLLTVGLVLLLFSAYEIWGKVAIVNEHQAQLEQQLAQDWEPTVGPTPTAAVDLPPSGAIARLYIPRLDKHWVVVQGVKPANIKYAPGHYPDSALPGEKGNFAVAGHRAKAIFWDLDKVQKGDPIVVETATDYYLYVVDQIKIVSPTAVAEVSPVPPGRTPGQALLTLTTCNPKWDNYQRLIVHAHLEGTRPHSDGPPPEIGG
jgi:LPXTG-site transpeptidase (sortase) family protein